MGSRLRRPNRSLTRRDVLKGGAGVLGLVAAGCTPESGASVREPPNVLLITADDLGWRDVGSMGGRAVPTPNLDRLADEGVSFDFAFDVASSCSSSRASFITGQYPHTHGVTGLAHVHPELSLPAGRRTLPRVLHEAGWSTALHGKWHVAPFDPVWDHGYAELLNDIPLPSYVVEDVASSIEFLERHVEQRFYLELNFMQTHRSNDGDFRMAEGFEVDPSMIAVPAYWNLPDWPEIRDEVARYFSQLAKMDALVGEVLTALQRLGLDQNTLIAFVSDNGPPFPGNKTTLYDRGTGTPLLLRWAGVLPAGRRVASLLSTIDLMPTLLDACGVEVPDEVQGRSFFALAAGETDAPLRDTVFSEMTYHREHIPMRAVRSGTFKYIRNYSDAPIGLDDVEDEDWAQRLVQLPDQPWTKPRVPEEFYDLRADPNERQNLIHDVAHAASLDELRALLDRHMELTGDPLLGQPFEITTA